MISRQALKTVTRGVTFAGQGGLKKLPVPPLKNTAEKYLKSVLPYLTPEEFAATKAKVEDFVKPGGLGETLHKRLEERNEALPQGWFIDWWNEYAYFGYRDPIVINVSYFFQFVDDKKFKTQTSRAASLIQAALDYRAKLLREEIEPDTIKGKPLDMSQFKFMFNSTRIPLPKVDGSKHYDPQENHHIAVVRNNQFFTFDSFHPDGSPLSTSEIETQLQRIIKIADSLNDQPVIGLLTTENRDAFTEAREKLLKISPQNGISLEKLQSSAFLVCLDKSSPMTRGEVGRALWHGDGKNRFFDKSLQFIVFENGKAGFNGEHSLMDGTPTNRLTEAMLDNLSKGKINHGTSSRGDLPLPEKLTFVSNPDLEKIISKAEENFTKLVEQNDHHVEAFLGYGKNFIKKAKFSPDAFVQMSIQLAYYKLFGFCRGTYESAATRQFLNGRTEVARTVSVDSMNWVKSMNSSASDAEKLQLLRKAVDSHVKYMNEAVDGQGVDRHLLGLRLIAKEGESHEMFQDKAFKESSYWALSTSQLSSEHYDGYGWGQVVPDGFGIAYMIKNDSLHYNVACLRSFASARRLGHCLEESLLEMKRICEVAAIPSKI